MPTPTFSDWLGNRAQEAPASDRLAMLIASAGAAGVPLDRLRRLCGLSPETLQDILRALTATGQAQVVKVGGQLVYRATM